MPDPKNSDRKTILVIDDEPSLLRLVGRVLERAEHRVWSAASGAEGLRLFAEHADAIDVVLLDVILPDARADTILAELRTRRPDLDVILTSGDQIPEALEAQLGEHGGRFLRKPFVPKVLLRVIDGGEGDGPPRRDVQPQWTTGSP